MEGSADADTTAKSSDFGLEIFGEAWLEEEAEEHSAPNRPRVKYTGDFSRLLLGKVREENACCCCG